MMTTSNRLLVMVSILFLTYTCCIRSDSDSNSESDESDDGAFTDFVSRIAVANRGSGDGLLIESDNDSSLLFLEFDDNSEPMYIGASPLTNEVYIGDRGNSQIYVYDTTTLKRVDIIPGCNGIFHEWYNFLNQLWIVCDIDLSILIIDTEKREQLTTISIDGIENMSGYKPHDIISNTEYAFVSLLKSDDPNGYIIKYSAITFQEINRIQIGGDPHLWFNDFDPNPNYIYVTSQTLGLLYRIDYDTLDIVSTLAINGAHGIWGTADYLYVTDITSQDGKDGLYVINQNQFDTVIVFDAVIGAPHNLMINTESNKLFVTHSGYGAVSVYDIESDGGLNSKDGRIIFEKDGSIPFGIMNIISFNELQYMTNSGN